MLLWQRWRWLMQRYRIDFVICPCLWAEKVQICTRQMSICRSQGPHLIIISVRYLMNKDLIHIYLLLPFKQNFNCLDVMQRSSPIWKPTLIELGHFFLFLLHLCNQAKLRKQLRQLQMSSFPKFSSIFHTMPISWAMYILIKSLLSSTVTQQSSTISV